MSLFFWKHNKTIDRFAVRLADELYSMVPPELATDFILAGDGRVGKKIRKKMKGKEARKADTEMRRVDNVINDTISNVTEFRARMKLGVYGKARLHMKFMARLSDLGYEHDLAESINELVMLRTP